MSPRPLSRLATLLGLYVVVLASACGDDAAPGVDGGPDTYTLEVLNPPGESIGLPFLGSTALRARYLDPQRRPIAGAAVAFSIVTSASESSGGASLSSQSATTDELGIARVDLVAGAERVNFRVQVSAPRAASRLFYIQVSEQGFTNLAVTPVHVGSRDPVELTEIQVRLYRAQDLRCSGLDPDAPPESLFPPRAVSDFGIAAEYPNLSSAEPYTALAWAAAEAGGTSLAFGCVDIGATQVRKGQAIGLTLVVADRPLVLPSAAELRSFIDLTNVAAALEARGAVRAWDVLACPLGPAQLLIDCALDAEASDGALDCVVGGTSALVADVQGTRGDPDQDGCRPATDGSAQPSADKLLFDQMQGGPWPTGQDLADLLKARPATIDVIELRSELRFTGPGIAEHHLLAAASVGAGAFEEDLTASARPVLLAGPVGAGVDQESTLTLAHHSFTLRLGSFARAAFDAVGLAQTSLDARADDLGAALVDTVNTGTQTGCDGLSTVVCTAAARPADCLFAACASAGPALDDELAAWWRTLDGVGLDLSLSGSAPLIDNDNDLQVDAVGEEGNVTGSWDATLTFSDGETAPAQGIFASSSTVP